jgi:capsid protein
VRGAVLVGRPGFPAPNAFLDDPDQYLRVRWRKPGWDTVNPVDDAQADRIMLQDGTITREEICAKRGVDWEELGRQWELENSLFGMAGDPAKNAAIARQDDDDDNPQDDRPPVEPLDTPGEDN